MKSKKKIIPLLASLSIVAGPVLILTACDTGERDMNNLPNGAINNNYKNRVLFSFNGVNFSKTVEQQFKDTYQQGLDFILKYVQGIMAEQNFYEFFHNTLNYSKEQSRDAFEKIKDDLGLSLLTQKYLAGLGTANSLDKISAQDKNELLFQNQSWHQGGTSIFDYENVEFYKKEDTTTNLKNNPNILFTPANLYKEWDADKEAAFDKQLETVAKHADTSYNDDISNLLSIKKWTDSAGEDTKQKTLDNSDIPTYHKYLKRFQWWLRFRYQQYYQYEILPELNKSLFTMSYILNNILSIKNNPTTNTPLIKATQNTFITQLQDIEKWDKSKFNLTWNFNTDLQSARAIDKKWNIDKEPPNWAEIVNQQKDNKYTLNANFFTRMTSGSSPSLNNIDANFGINGFNSAATDAEQNSQWKKNDGGLHYTNVNNTATFTYTAPIYFLNLIQNLDFSYLMGDGQSKNWIVSTDEMIQKWINSRNPSINTNFSKYIRGGADSTITQDQKWNIFLQMLYSISTGDTGTENYKTAASNLFPKYIPKNNIYEDGFWKQVKEFYP